ncbi:MAG: hypothetical protein IAF01_05085 [Xanthomonadaceae bacterium]|nr:hypothetical protein [Xanthomonadaceae bacterium]MCA0196719.1 hypothetical protein [Pseudomonadota bacterium]
MDAGPDWEYKRIRNIGISGTRNLATGIKAFNLYCEGNLLSLRNAGAAGKSALARGYKY